LPPNTRTGTQSSHIVCYFITRVTFPLGSSMLFISI
jgi:hypothetical protein